MKRIALCFDGTGNVVRPEGNTNVLQLFRRIEYYPDRQLTYYDPGVGTFSAAGAWTPPAQRISRLQGLAFGAGLRTNLEEAYTFLINHWDPGDEIYIFGFSRGAYTARAMAGLLCRIGVLRPGSENLVRYAVSTYARRKSNWANDDWKQAAQYKSAFGRLVNGKYEAPVTYLGIWDTVKAPGLLRRSMTWPDTRVLKNVVAGRHAVSIDEKRRPFREYLVDKKARDRIDEVWFAGVHSDIGGSYMDAPSLGDITLNWIAEGAKKAGLEFRDCRPFPVLTPAHATGLIHKMGRIWALALYRTRPIPPGARVHDSVRARIKQQPKYARGRIPSEVEWAEPDWLGVGGT
jgi:uncharacterized protein (DUF2235 family)